MSSNGTLKVHVLTDDKVQMYVGTGTAVPIRMIMLTDAITVVKKIYHSEQF